MGVPSGVASKMHESMCSISFSSILINPENNPEFSMKEMALAGRPEPHGQRKYLWLAGQSLAGLPSDRMPHRELPDLCAEHFSNRQIHWGPEL